MANAFIMNSDDEPKEYTDLIQKIYTYAKQMGCEDEIEYEKEYDQYFTTQKFEMDSTDCESIHMTHKNCINSAAFW